MIMIKKDNRGAGIIWAIAAIMILLVIVAGSLTFSYYTYSAQVDNGAVVQAEFSARNSVEAIASYIEETESVDYVPSVVGTKIDVTVDLPESNMGTVTSAYVKRVEEKELFIYTNVKIGRVSVECMGYMTYVNGGWKLYQLDNLDNGGTHE